MTEQGAVILVGGSSRRMGTPKAWLEFDGQPLLRILVDRLLTVFPEVAVVAAPGQELPQTAARIVYDEDPDQGPVAGLAVGLREVRAPLAFVTSCDVPFLDLRVADHILRYADHYDIVVPQWGGRLHPLQAAYKTGLHSLMADRIAKGQRRLTDLLDDVCTLVVTEDELREIDPQGLSFLNVNTPEDYQRALQTWAKTPPCG